MHLTLLLFRVSTWYIFLASAAADQVPRSPSVPSRISTTSRSLPPRLNPSISGRPHHYLSLQAPTPIGCLIVKEPSAFTLRRPAIAERPNYTSPFLLCKDFLHFYFKNWLLISLNKGVAALRSHSKATISRATISMPCWRILARASSLQ